MLNLFLEDIFLIIQNSINILVVEKKGHLSKAAPSMRYETDKGKQAQLDWKENIEFVLNTGEIININIFVLILSYSRFRVYRLSLDKTQDILFSF